MRLMKIRLLRKTPNRKKPIRVFWDLADYLRDLDDGWVPHHWSSNWKLLTTQDGWNVFLIIRADSRSRPEDTCLIAEIYCTDTSPNSGGVSVDWGKVGGGKKYALTKVLPMVEEVLQNFGMDYEVLERLEND